MKTIQIAIDGPASSGKSTVAKIIAKDFGYTYLDTGAMYRAATYMALRNQLGVEQVEELLDLLDQHPISFGRSEAGEQLVFVGDVDITHPIRENEVTNHVSVVAAIPEIREKLVSLQQEIAQQGGIVMDGRDIGTVVLPQAELKIFLVVSKTHINICRDKENLAKVRVYIYAAEGSDVSVWMDYSSNNENEGALAVQTLVYAEKNAKVKLYQVGLQSDSDISLNDIGANVDKDASFELVQLLLGGKKLFAGARASLVGKRSEFISDLGYYGKAEDQIDLNYVADHIGKSTNSKMIASGVLNDNSGKLLRGTIDFKRGAKDATGEESEDVLLLGQNIHNQSIPVILCAEEDVVGTHGASIGNLDDEMLFYLTSRGMDKESVTKMVARARIDAIGKKLENVALEEKINVYLGGSEDEQERI